jgi:hypothetical protein
MRHALIPHLDSPSSAAKEIEVDIARPSAGMLVLRYAVTGKLGDLRLPPMAAPARGHELWQHSCFEAFLRAGPGASYYEFNFSPSLQWAAYGFDGYRSGMRVAHEIGALHIEVQSDATQYELQAMLELDRLPDVPIDALWHLGLSAVIEDARGKSYWALAHPPGKPDFHHPDCFALELAAAWRS